MRSLLISRAGLVKTLDPARREAAQFNTALEPTAAPLVRSTVAGVRERVVRSTGALRRLSLSWV